MSKPPTSPSAENTTADPDIQRWTAKRKAAVVLDLIRGKTTAAETARLHGLTVGEVDRWRDDFITQGTEGLRSHPRDLAEQHEAERQKLLAKVGELTLHVDVLKKVHRLQGRDLPDGL
jgi:transposase-like protein